MSTAMAKKRDEERRKPGRPPTGVETDAFCCRAPVKLITAFVHLARAKLRGGRAGTELLQAAESHLIGMYRLIRDDADTKLLDPVHASAFLEAAEEYFKEAHIKVD